MKLTKELEEKIREENRKLHNQGADNYDNYPPYLLEKEDRINFEDIRFIRKMLKKDKPIALDCGCGTGKLAINMIKNGFETEILDISKNMVKIAKKKIKDKTKIEVKGHVSDSDKFFNTGKNKYDLICFTATLHHIGDYNKTLKLAIKSLNKGGCIYITDGQKKKDDFVVNVLSAIGGHANNLYKAVKNPMYAMKFMMMKFRKKDSKESINVELAEFHAGTGIDDKKLLRFFEKNRCKVEKYETFQVNYFRFLEIFDFLLKNKPKLFKLVVRKS